MRFVTLLLGTYLTLKGDGFRDEWRKSVTNEHWSEIYGVQFET